MITIMLQQIFTTEIKLNWRRFLCISVFFLTTIFNSGCNSVKQTEKLVYTPLSPTLVFVQKTPQPNITTFDTATPTWTPMATLPVEIRKQNLIELFSTNGGCDFPCWWGVNSGDSIQKAAELTPKIGKSLHLYGNFLYSYTLSLDDSSFADFYAEFHVDVNQIIQRMEINLAEPSRLRDYQDVLKERLSLHSILQLYGKPSEILFLVTPRFEPGETPRPYTLFLIYDIQGFGIVYSGLVDNENPLQVCSIKLDNHRLQHISLYLQDPRPKIAEINRFNSTKLQSLEEVTAMSMDDFYQAFSTPDNKECIETIIDPWQ